MVSALDSGASAPGSSPGRGHCVEFLGKTLSQCLSPPRCTNGYLRIVGENLTICGGVTCNGLASRPEEVEVFDPQLLTTPWVNWIFTTRLLIRTPTPSPSPENQSKRNNMHIVVKCSLSDPSS